MRRIRRFTHEVQTLCRLVSGMLFMLIGYFAMSDYMFAAATVLTLAGLLDVFRAVYEATYAADPMQSLDMLSDDELMQLVQYTLEQGRLPQLGPDAEHITDVGPDGRPSCEGGEYDEANVRF